MIRSFLASRSASSFALALGLSLLASQGFAQSSGSKPAAKTSTTAGKATGGKPAAEKTTASGKTTGKKDTKTEAAPGKPALVGTFGDWGVYVAPGKSKTCYALAQPKERTPKDLKRDPGYVFISTRPAENVRNEVSIAMGFDVKATPEPKAEVGSASFSMVAKGGNLWVKNAAEEGPLLEAMRKSGKMVVRGASMKGNVSVDTYVLAGLSEALGRIKKECP